MYNLRGLLGIRRRDRVPNARIRELCGVTKGVEESIDEGWWFGHVKGMENDRIAKSLRRKGHKGEIFCFSSLS